MKIEQKYLDQIKTLATKDNALEYSNTVDQFLFCQELLDFGILNDKAEYIINLLEDEFDKINQN